MTARIGLAPTIGSPARFLLRTSGRLPVQSCHPDLLFEPDGKDVVLEVCVEAVSRHEQVVEWVDNRIAHIVARQRRGCELYLAGTVQLGDQKTRARHKHVSCGIGDNLSGCRNLSRPDAVARRMKL